MKKSNHPPNYGVERRALPSSTKKKQMMAVRLHCSIESAGVLDPAVLMSDRLPVVGIVLLRPDD